MSASGELVSAVIQIIDDSNNPIEVFPVLFNPSKYELSKQIKYGSKDIAGLTTPITQFASGDAETLSMELFFDTSELQMDVNVAMELLDELVDIDGHQHAPPRCRFIWGSLTFKAVVESLDRSFTKFLPTGQPVRARANITFREYKTAKEQRNRHPLFSADTTTVHTVRAGETLWLIAAEAYGDATAWRHIADANDIENPRDIRDGQELVVPDL